MKRNERISSARVIDGSRNSSVGSRWSAAAFAGLKNVSSSVEAGNVGEGVIDE